METTAIQIYVESYRALEEMKRPKGIRKYETFADVVERVLIDLEKYKDAYVPPGKD
jgi:predicted CopG family antitoxin